jgi:thiol-disulfide isomerase/thioredoxin
MSNLHKSLLGLGLAAIALTGCAPKDEAVTSNPAPARTATAAAPNLDAVAKEAPAVVYFVKADCGSNPSAIPLINKIYAANRDSGKFFVVMNTDQAGADAWAKEWKTEFPIIPDPDKKLIGQYGIEHSQTGILVDKELKETKRFAGYGKDELVAMNESLGTAKVDLSDAPPAGAG